MKIAYLGNTCNNSYSFLKAFRKFGLSGTLYYDTEQHPQTFPESENKDLFKPTCKWLKPFGTNEKGIHPWIRPTQHLLDEISKYDILHCEDVGLLWANLTGKPYYWHIYGYDLHKFPFFSFWLLSHSIRNFEICPEYLTAPIRYRNSILHANAIKQCIIYT